MAIFQSRDPNSPAFWDERFERHFMPWDRGAVPVALQQFAVRAPRAYVTLIPGCGHAYEVAWLSQAGWNVTAIDFSPAAVSAARTVLGAWAHKVEQADFFVFEPRTRLDLIYERAFLCALPRDRWPAIAARWAELLAPGALLAGFFYFGDDAAGPPFGITRAQLGSLLDAHFECIEDSPVDDSIAVFSGKERWQVWRRLD